MNDPLPAAMEENTKEDFCWNLPADQTKRGRAARQSAHHRASCSMVVSIIDPTGVSSQVSICGTRSCKKTTHDLESDSYCRSSTVLIDCTKYDLLALKI